MKEELERARRVSDMLTTCHSVLRDRYARRSTILDVTILAISAWVAALGFVDPVIAEKIALPKITATMTIGLFGLAAFILSLFQLRVDWKQRSDRHAQAARGYAASKLDLQRAMFLDPSSREVDTALRNYANAGENLISVPDKDFNSLRQVHLRKLRVSDEVKNYPGASMWFIRLKIFLQDTFGLFSKVPNDRI